MIRKPIFVYKTGKLFHVIGRKEIFWPFYQLDAPRRSGQSHSSEEKIGRKEEIGFQWTEKEQTCKKAETESTEKVANQSAGIVASVDVVGRSGAKKRKRVGARTA